MAEKDASSLTRQLAAAIELTHKVELERDGLRELYESTSGELAKLRHRIAEAVNRTSDVILYSSNTLKLLRGEDIEPE